MRIVFIALCITFLRVTEVVNEGNGRFLVRRGVGEGVRGCWSGVLLRRWGGGVVRHAVPTTRSLCGTIWHSWGVQNQLLTPSLPLQLE